MLRDVPGRPLIMMRSRDNDQERLSLFPSLDYKGLYSTLLQFLDLIVVIPSGNHINTLYRLYSHMNINLITKS